MAGERSADDIQRDIEQSRAALAHAVDQLVERGSPKALAANAKQGIKAKAQSREGKIALGVVGGVFVLLVIRRIRKH